MSAPALDQAPTTTEETPAGVALHFPEGLLGFPTVQDFLLVESVKPGLFWLEHDDPSGAPRFLLADPFRFIDGYAFDLTPGHADKISVGDPSKVCVLVITVPGHSDWTANLQGPLVVNLGNGIGAQVVLSDRSLSVRRPFRPF